MAIISKKEYLSWHGKKVPDNTESEIPVLYEIFAPEETISTGQNLLFQSDNLNVIKYLLNNGYREKIDLIYIDPPFNSNAGYYKKIKLDENIILQEIQYSDIWNLDEYLQFMYERLILLRELLSERGSIYLHCDWRVNSYLRLMLDEIFGAERLVNEIIWCFTSGGKGNRAFSKKHNTIYYYSKTDKYIFNADEIRIPYSTKTYQNYKKGLKGSCFTAQVELNERGKIPEDYLEIAVASKSLVENEYNYPTQKPEKLLERIIKTSSQPDSIVFDCFMGSGTTLACAEKLGRKWIGCDASPGSLNTVSKRLQNIILSNNKSSFFLYKTPDKMQQNLSSVEIEINKIDSELHIKIKKFTPKLLLKKITKYKNELNSAKIDFMSLIDMVQIDTDYDGEVFNIHHSILSNRKKGMINSCFKVKLPEVSKSVALKIIDIRGDEYFISAII